MDNVENVVAEEQQSNQPEATPKKPNKFLAGLKEWCRKQIVTLKRKPQRIPFLFFIVSTIIYLLSLGTLSQATYQEGIYNLGLSVFIVTLCSILVIPLFMNTFPKHGIRYKEGGKKHTMNYIMLGLTFAFIAVMFVFDWLFYNQLLKCINGNEARFFQTAEQAAKFADYLGENYDPTALGGDSYKAYYTQSFTLTKVHMIFLGISAVLLATLPLYRKLILKINTKKDIGESQLKEVIETEDE